MPGGGAVSALSWHLCVKRGKPSLLAYPQASALIGVVTCTSVPVTQNPECQTLVLPFKRQVEGVKGGGATLRSVDLGSIYK